MTEEGKGKGKERIGKALLSGHDWGGDGEGRIGKVLLSGHDWGGEG